MMAILDLVRDAVTPQLVHKMSEVIGESPGAIEKGMSAAVPALLNAIAERASTVEGAERMRAMIVEGGYGAGMLDRLDGLRADGATPLSEPPLTSEEIDRAQQERRERRR